MDFLQIIWKLCFTFTKNVFLHAPKWAGGFENQKTEDICAVLMGISSSYFFTVDGSKMCEEKIDNKITSIAMVILTAVIVIAVTYIPYLLKVCFGFFREYQTIQENKIKEVAKTEKRLIASSKAKATREKNAFCFSFTKSVITTVSNPKLSDAEVGKIIKGQVASAMTEYSAFMNTCEPILAIDNE